MMGQGVFTVGILMLVDSTVSLCLGAASQRPATRRSGSEESCPPLHIFWYFWLTIQNTAISQVRNLFSVAVVLISFPLARAAAAVAAADFCCYCCWAPPPHPAPFIFGEGSTKKIKSRVASEMALGNVCVGVGVVEVAVQCTHHTSEV